jgi:tetratricopeptide (TPR) repeat protein
MSKEMRPIVHVSPEDPELQEVYAQERKECLAEGSFFKEALEKVRMLQNDERHGSAEHSSEVAKKGEDLPTLLQESVAMYIEALHYAYRKNDWGDGFIHAVERFNTILFSADLQQFTIHTIEETKEALDAFEDFIENDASPETLLAFAKAYDALHKHNTEWLQNEIFPHAKECFRKRFLELSEEGFFPVSVQTHFQNHFDEITAAVLEYVSENEMSFDDGMMFASRHIWIADHLTDSIEREFVEHVIFHEILHTLSGTSTQKDTRGFMYRKIGTAIKASKAIRFSWLNEAITEWMALRLSGYRANGTYKGSESYIEERKTLQRFLDAGLPEELLVQAYFENIITGDPNATGQYFKKLVAFINEKEGSGAFNRIENEFTLQNVISKLNVPMYWTAVLEKEFKRKDVPEDEGVRVYNIRLDIGNNRTYADEGVVCVVEDDATKEDLEEELKQISDNGRVFYSVEEMA